VIVLLPLALIAASCDRQSPLTSQPDRPATAKPGKIDRSQAGTATPTDPFNAPDGKTVTLAAFRGTPLLVNLWATWCGPCVKEMPSLDRLAARTGTKLRVLTVSQDMQGRAAVDRWWTGKSLTKLERYVDDKNNLGFALGGGSLPTTVLYDANGREVWRVTGELDWDGATARALLAPVIG